MVVLDTNALIFDALEPARLSRKARALIERAQAEGALCCADISLWEIAMLVAKGRLAPGTGALEFIKLVLAARSVTVLPVTAEIADLSTSLPERVSGDPADRLIAATAIHHRATLVTADQNLRKAGLSIAVVG